MQAQEITANINRAECIRSISNIGETIYHNICNQTQTIVPWGTMDWVGAVMFSFLCLALCGLLVGLLAMMLDGF